jgi:hypothetical protein
MERVIQAEAEIIQLNRQFLSLQYAGIAIATSADLPDILDAIAQDMARLLRAKGCAIYEWRQENQTVLAIAQYGLDSNWRKSRPVETYALAEFSLIARVLSEQRAQQITINHPEIYPAELADMQRAKLKTMLLTQYLRQKLAK